MHRILLLSLLLTGCSSVQLAPSSIRHKEYTVTTDQTKDKNFDRIQAWAAKAGGTIRLNDRQAGIVVLRANVTCDALKLGSGFAKDQVLWFVLEMQAADKSIVTKFTELEASTPSGSYDAGLRPSNQAEVDIAVRECIDPIQYQIQTALKN